MNELKIYLDSGGELKGSVAASYSDIQGCGGSAAWIGGYCGSNNGGNIDADPLFLDAAGGNLRLGLTSPAIDAGDNALVPVAITADLDGLPRFVDIPGVPDTGGGTPPIVDMGAYEAHPDSDAPTVLSITRLDPDPTAAAGVRFLVLFSEAVTGVAAGDFSLTASGITGASVTGVSGGPTAYTIAVSTGDGDGSLRLDIPDTASITDLAGNPLGGLPYTGGESYTFDRTAPMVDAITRADINPTGAASVDFSVLFSEVVTGVDAGDFTIHTTGSVSGASVTNVSGAGTMYTVTAGTGKGGGTLRLDIPGAAAISDLTGNPLSGLPYEDGEAYAVLYKVYLPLAVRSTP